MGPSNNGRRLLLLATLALAVDSVTALSSGNGPDYPSVLENFKTPMEIVMVALVMAFFLLGFFSICLHRCAGPPPPAGSGLDDDDEYHLAVGMIGITHARTRRTTRGRGLDRAVLDAFPTMAYADAKVHSRAGGAALECAVCLSEFDDGDTLRLLQPRCAHAFHADCVDAWLASHVTCPVCRAVLAPAPSAAAAAAPATEHHDDHAVVPAVPPRRQPAIDTAMASPEQAAVAVVVVDAAAVGGETEEEQRIRREEAAELMRIGSVKRALRSKSGRRPARFPRSHTTGHSLAAPSPLPSPAAADSERYTLRLPDHVLREVVAVGNLRRSASVQTGGGGSGTTRRGFGIARAGSRSVRLGNSGRWPNMSVLARTFSARLPAWGSVRRGEADATPKGAKFAGGGDGRGVEQCDAGACPLGAHV